MAVVAAIAAALESNGYSPASPSHTEAVSSSQLPAGTVAAWWWSVNELFEN
jgi:hypothetical protein